MSLYCYVYTSISSQKMTDQNLMALLSNSRKQNHNLGITGMLLYLDPYFIQVLEGEEAIIDNLYNSIKQDTRHHKVTLIYKKPVAIRSFSNWTMGFNKISDENLDALEGFSDFLQRPNSEFFSHSPSKVDELLHMFKHETLF